MKDFNTRDIALEFEISHKTVLNIIKKYYDDFASLSPTEFKVNYQKPGIGSKGGKPKSTYILNIWQRKLLILYLKTTKKTSKLKFDILNSCIPKR